MIKNIYTALILAFILSSCQSAIKDEVVSDKETPEKVVEEIKEPVHSKVNNNTSVNEKEDLIGYWVGWFLPDEDSKKYDDVNNVYNDGIIWERENKITVSIDTIRNDSVIGHSIVAGNFRPFQGTIKLDDNIAYVINAAEPGNDKYDGEFSFEIVKKMDTIHGKWKAFKEVQTRKRKYSLTKKSFEYNPNVKINRHFVDWLKKKTHKEDWGDGEFEMESYFTTTDKVTSVNPSVDLLTQEQVEKLTKADIFVLRNSIYAKHGYSFKKRALRVFFDSHDWYMPVHVNIKSELTDIEKKNIKLLLRYEKYAEEYYDEFGRG